MLQDYLLDTFIYICIYAILAISLNLEAGFGRLMNFGKVAFFAIGAYTSTIFSMTGAPFMIGLLAGMLISSILGFFVALPALRLKADYLAIVTLSFGEILRLFLLNEQWLTNGPMGIRGIPQPLFNLFLENYLLFYAALVFVLLIICYVFSERLINSPFGRTLKGIRDDEEAVSALGKDTFRIKVRIFMIGSCMAAVSGALFAHYIAFISPDMFFPSLTFSIWTMMVIGGSANNLGVITGAVLVQVLERGTRFIKDFVTLPFDPSNVRIIIIGLLLILFILYRPDGIIKEKKRRL